MNDTDNQRRYRALIGDRRARGHDLYGDRHLTAATGQLRRATSELADAHVYIGLERDRIRHGRRMTAGRLHAFERLVEHTRRVGEQLAAAARDICDPTVQFESVRRERSAYGERKFGDQYLQRDNLQEVLEELADASIFVGLQADRLRHRGIYEDDVQCVLVAAESAVSDLASDVMRLQTAIAEMDGQPAEACSRSSRAPDARVSAAALHATDTARKQAPVLPTRPHMARG